MIAPNTGGGTDSTITLHTMPSSARMIRPIWRWFVASVLTASMAAVAATDLDPVAKDRFIAEMVQRHGFSDAALRSLFARVRLSNTVLEAIARPAEGKPWFQYRSIFLTSSRIQSGIDFWLENRSILNRASARFGVAPEIIVAIIGVETFYGRRSGDYRVADALSTLAFNYPPRAPFFRSELENFLLFSREQGFDPLNLKGSYAGAMGVPQFMPSSYRRYAVDFSGDGRIDIWNNTADVIASVANYLTENGWERGGAVATRATVQGNDYTRLLAKTSEPTLRFDQLAAAGVRTSAPLAGNPLSALLSLQAEVGDEVWVTLKNFSVIRKYNRSALYAMAVHQLAESVRRGVPGERP